MRTILTLFCTLFAFSLFAGMQQFTLDNGLKILVKEDHRAPVAIVMMWYKVGSADDQAGVTGVAHVLEHMMFKGTPTYPAGVFSKTIGRLGGQANAMTSNDYTAYFEKIATEHIQTCFELEADRMQHLTLDAAAFTQEIKVIQEERRLRTDDNPQALTLERFLATAHLIAPYQHPVIGWMNDLQNLTIHDVRTGYQRFYAPNHATLVVVGDVSPTTIYTQAKKTFHSLKKQPVYSHKPQQEPPALGKKTIDIHGRVKIPMLMRGYTVPSVKSAEKTPLQHDPYVLEIIAALLDAGDSGRLQHHLVRDRQQASSVGVDYNLYTRYETQFILYATPTESHTLETLAQALEHEIMQLKTQPVSETELQRVKTQLIAQKTFERDSLFGQAMELGLLETIELNWQTLNQYETQIRQVTPAHIQTVANAYFQDTRQTDARLTPQAGAHT
ncbi:MAG: peptidase M16 [Legionellales bacterium RIFCSPHIGHO2_12_FULL_42_9]|nr:MAG: peptidase M16 [Legionellales bacterium RIFCSPHIGHO2_12_FULL_42_9]